MLHKYIKQYRGAEHSEHQTNTSLSVITISEF